MPKKQQRRSRHQHNSVHEITERFVAEISQALSQSAKEEILSGLGVDFSGPSRPSLPYRRPKQIGPAKTRKKKELQPYLAKIHAKIQQSKTPVTIDVMESRWGMNRGSARAAVTKLIAAKLLSSQPVEDGTRRRVYQALGR